MPRARPATTGDLPAIATTLTRAFAPFDFVRAGLPGPRFEERLRELYELFAGHALARGDVWVADDGAAAALWQPPGESGEAAPGTLERVTELLGDGLEHYLAAAEAIAAHRPVRPHWYLDVLGTDPARRHEGLARATLLPALERCDAEGLPALTDTSAPENLPFYAALGFSVRAEYDVAPDGPHVWVLSRGMA